MRKKFFEKNKMGLSLQYSVRLPENNVRLPKGKKSTNCKL